MFFAILFFIPGVGHFVNEYLLPHFPKSESDGPLFGTIIGLFFIGIGWYLMRQGTKKQQNLERK
jgi:hypothetical protein